MKHLKKFEDLVDEPSFDETEGDMNRRELDSEIDEMENNLKNSKKSNIQPELDARKIVANILKSYNLGKAEHLDQQDDIANEIINDLVYAGFMK